jgi:hypothetical protein
VGFKFSEYTPPTTSAKPTQGVWGLAPKKNDISSNGILLFPEKEAKSVGFPRETSCGV